MFLVVAMVFLGGCHGAPGGCYGVSLDFYKLVYPQKLLNSEDKHQNHIHSLNQR